MRQRVVLVTGASGEIGHGLIRELSREGVPLLSLDLRPLDEALAPLVKRHVVASIVERPPLDAVLAEFEVDTIFHLAALLSTRGELVPLAAHQVNVEGTIDLIEHAHAQAASHGRPVRFLFPSSIAVYGLPDLETKRRAGRVREEEWTLPRTMYGCNKLYCELLGQYHARHYRQLDAEPPRARIDFRSIRFPGLISAETVPSGGTSDYAPEMLHAAAAGTPYDCFVRPDARIPFMAMPDAIAAILRLARAPAEALTRTVYNLGAFNPSAGELRSAVVERFSAAEIDFKPDLRRQAIVDSWPEDVDDSAARKDWGFSPRYDLARALDDYLVPAIRARYHR